MEQTDDSLPESLTGSLEIEDQKYYLFRNNRFCVRKFESGRHGSILIEEESIEMYRIDKNGNKKLISLDKVTYFAYNLIID